MVLYSHVGGAFGFSIKWSDAQIILLYHVKYGSTNNPRCNVKVCTNCAWMNFGLLCPNAVTTPEAPSLLLFFKCACFHHCVAIAFAFFSHPRPLRASNRPSSSLLGFSAALAPKFTPSPPQEGGTSLSRQMLDEAENEHGAPELRFQV